MDRDYFEMWLKWQGYRENYKGYWFRDTPAPEWAVGEESVTRLSYKYYHNEMTYNYKDLDLEDMMSVAVCKKYYG